MNIDHIYIFSNKGKETDELVEFGLTEGSGRRHQGIGTANRRLFFENFYLEILWVENETEAKNVEEIGIWERNNYKNNNYSPFGLCLENTDDTDQIFHNSIKWHPEFLDKKEYVKIITNEKIPWIFKFPKNRIKKNIEEPSKHRVGINKLTKAVFNLKKIDFKETLNEIENNSIIEFKQSIKDLLILEFDSCKQGKSKRFDKLNLEIRY
ncbi:MAG: VOC family protein [Bacteroidota bacterium]